MIRSPAWKRPIILPRCALFSAGRRKVNECGSRNWGTEEESDRVNASFVSGFSFDGTEENKKRKESAQELDSFAPEELIGLIVFCALLRRAWRQ